MTDLDIRQIIDKLYETADATDEELLALLQYEAEHRGEASAEANANADTPAHTWQVVSIGKSSIAHKAMLFAAKVIGLTGAQLMADREKLAQAQAEFAGRTTATPYICPIPKGISPTY